MEEKESKNETALPAEEEKESENEDLLPVQDGAQAQELETDGQAAAEADSAESENWADDPVLRRAVEELQAIDKAA